MTGRVAMQNNGTVSTDYPRISNPLIQQSFADKFYNELITEINRTYSYNLSRSTSVLIRTLLENLIISLFRTKHGTQKLDLYYDSSHGRFYEFSILLRNLRDHRADFNSYTSGFDDRFFDFLNKYREHGNSNAHSLEIYVDKKTLEADRDRINHSITVLSNAIKAIANPTP